MALSEYAVCPIFEGILAVIYRPFKLQARIFLSFSSQCETSEMRLSIERPHKKNDYNAYSFNNAYSLFLPGPGG